MIKRRLSAIISVIIICCLGLALYFTAANVGFSKFKAYFSDFVFSEEFKDEQPLSLYNFEKLNKTEKQAYVCIFESIKKHPEYIKIPSLTNDEFRNVYFSVKNDNPDILCFPDACDMITFFNSGFIHFDYSRDSVECDTMMTELSSQINQIVSGCSFKNEYEKELFCHDYIILNCSYDENAANGSDAYGCLVDKTAYCSGYSRAMMLLLDAVGVDSILVSGNAIVSGDEQESHMWNIVWIDSVPYHLDVTWDDQDRNGQFAPHMYFNTTTDTISVSHSDFSVDIQCISADANYFVRENLSFNRIDNNTVKIITDRLNENILNNSPFVEFVFTDDAVYNDAVDNYFTSESYNSAFYRIIEKLSVQSKELIDVTHINTVEDNELKYIRLMFDKK